VNKETDGDWSSNHERRQDSTNDPLHIHGGPMTKAKVKRIKEVLNKLIKKTWAKSHK